MAVYRNISSKSVITKVMRDLKPGNSDWVDSAIEWVGEALEHIGASSQLIQKQKVLNITDHKEELPADLYYINMVAVNSGVSSPTETELDEITTAIRSLRADLQEYNQSVAGVTNEEIEQYDTQYKSNVLELRRLNEKLVLLENVYFSADNSSSMTPLQYSASTFHSSMHCSDCVNEFAKCKESYIIDGGYIKTSFETGKVCLSYKAFPTDDECYPMVPDDISFKEALFWYIYKQMLLGGYDKPSNKIDYNFADQKWQQYCTQARNAANYPDIDRYQSFMDQWVRLIPDINRHSQFFDTLNDRENLYRE